MAYYTYLSFLEPKEEELRSSLNISSPQNLQGPLIAIGGFAGVGKDSLALGLKKILKKRYKIDVKIYGAGEHIREYARRMGHTDMYLDEFLRDVQHDEEFSKKIDQFADKQTLAQALGRGKGIFIGRMAPFALGRWASTIWVQVHPQVRANRLVSDKKRPEYGLTSEEVYSRIEKRDENDVARLERIYNFNFQEMQKKLDFILDNSDNTIEQSLSYALDSIIRTCPQKVFK